MPWRPLPRIAFAVATFPFQPSSPADLPLELGDELYIIEQGGKDGSWYRGYLVAPPSLLAGLTCRKGQTLEARVFSGIFPRSCVEVREELGEVDISQKLLNGRADGTTSPGCASDNALDADKELGNGQVKAEATRPNLTTHDSLKGLGLVTSRRQSQSRDITPTGENGSSFKSGPLIHPKSRKSSGLVPLAALDARDPQAAKPAAPVPMLKIGDETPTSLSEPLVDEIASCLREWHSTNLHELLLTRQYGTLEKMSTIVSQLDLTRRQLLHDVLTGQERIALREQAVWDLVKGNKMLSGEVIVRDPAQGGRLLTGEDSAIEMTKLQSMMSLLDSGPVAHPESLALHHLLLEIKGVTGTVRGAMILTASLCLKTEDGEFSPLSETFVVDVSAAEDIAKLARSGKLKTLYTDLSASDVGEPGAATKGELYLVVKLQATQKPKTAPLADSTALSRNGTLTNKNANATHSAQQDTLWGGRRSKRFGSIRKPGLDRRNAPNQNGRHTPQGEDAPPPPISKEAPVLEVSPKNKVKDVVRIIGVGLLDIGAVMRQEKDVEQSIIIWSPATTEEETDDDGDKQTFDPAISKLLRSPTGRYLKSSRASRVNLHLSPFTSPDAQSLIRRNPTTMHMITQTQKIGFSEAPTKMRSDIYITLSEAVISRAALLSHPESGSIQMSRSSPFLNLQLTIEVRDGLGRRLENSIYPSSNSTGHTAWRTVVVEQGERWSQTICLKIPPDQVSGSHLIMSIAEAPEFPFALVWMPLWDRQAFIHDGRHALLMHAYDRTTSSVAGGKGAYLSLPWQAAGKDFASQIGDASGHMATLFLETFLCSTEHSQDQVIIGLINWKQQPFLKLFDLLRKLVFVPEIEIVKQRNDVFDALFALLVHKSGEPEYEALIFSDLITVLGIVHDRRFNLGPLVDQYAEHHFKFAAAASCLIRCYTELLQNASGPKQSRDLRASFKVGRYIMKFIITARQQQKFQAEEMVARQNNFNEEMQSIFRSLESLMRNESAALVGSKTLLVQHFHSWLPELLSVFSAEEVIRIATRFIDSCEAVKGKLALYRIILVLNYTQIDNLWRAPAERQKLIANCVRWLSPYWGDTDRVTEQWRDQVRLCASVVAELLKEPTPALYDFMPKIVTSYCTIKASGLTEKNTLSLLFSKSYPFLPRPTNTKETFDEALLELAALMASISDISPASTCNVPRQDLSGYILSTLKTQQSILECGGAYPGSWLSLNVYHHRSSLEILKHVSILLRKSFLPSPDFAEDFDMELWKTFFTTLLKVVGSEVLALETFPEQKRRAVWKIAGDVRETGAELLRRAWDMIGWETSADENRRYGLKRLGGYQVQYVPSLVSPIVELCLSVHEGVRRVAVEILKTMIVSEWALSEDLSPIETEMIASLDVIFKTKRINESVTQKLFIGELLEMFGSIASQPDDALWVALKVLLTTIDELLELLMAAHGDSMESSLYTLRLMDFMKDMQKEDIYIRYVHDLAHAQEKSKNSTEAGLALQLHAELYSWNSSVILPALTSPAFPAQSAFDRKEAIYFQMIQHFENGRAWSLALTAYRELAELYEHVTFDFFKLARTQRAMAQINQSIAKEPRQPPRYFKVSYRGLGFVQSIRDKQYIFEESPSERMATFTDRMQKQHPAAQVTQSKEVDDLEGQFVQVTSVSAQRDFSHPVNSRARVPGSTKDHLLTSNPVQFSATVKRHTVGTNVKEHWVEKIVYTTAEPFPNILRQSEIVSAAAFRLSPIQTAIERTWRKTAELHLLEKRAASGDDPNNSSLTATLLQLLDIDSSSGSCLAHYRQLLPEPSKDRRGDHSTTDTSREESDTGSTCSDDSPSSGSTLETALYVALLDHAAAIKHCLTLYARPSLQTTRKALHEKFDAIYPQEARLANPSGAGNDHGSHSHSHSGGSGVHRPLVDQPHLSHRETEMEYANHNQNLNGGVVSPDLSESGRVSRQGKSHRLSLQALRGAATSMQPDMNEPRRTNTVHSRSNTTHSVSTNPASAPANSQSNGIIIPGLLPGTTFPDASSGPPTNAADNTTQSTRETSHTPQAALTVTKRRSISGGSTTSDVPGPAILATASEPNDEWGRSLKDSLGANISISRFEMHDETKDLVHPGDEDNRSVTTGSGNTESEGKKVAKKRFSLMRLGMKKSGNSLSAKSDVGGVEK